ncbi:hypothetical protein WSK_2132 [Novosphingobium sp. Rr 2-17]|uniref:hypothetical protein n=1 Tax=Novosphingobium sp. Rr 2-17 TaxID=555793 RepID=UPI0002698ED9|nr:hypothetical protein [Novosphingobium sp. Rr 2-17]EIZ79287.1 hypothetical protein WSK_2132 [Novosphingobium sp. Rr 2-17]
MKCLVFSARQRHSAAAVVLTLAVLAFSSGPASAQSNPFDAPATVRVVLPADPARNDVVAKRSIAMLDKAALTACGGSDYSFAQVKVAVRKSACWHQAMAGAIEQVGDDRLSTWWAAHHS